MTHAIQTGPARRETYHNTNHGILFKDDMVRALLAGHKTQTRRLVHIKKNHHLIYDLANARVDGPSEFCQSQYLHVPFRHLEEKDFSEGKTDRIFCTLAQQRFDVGHTMWVKEAWKPNFQLDTGQETTGTIYRATESDPVKKIYGGNWQSSLLMPKARCRLNLLIESIRVQRIQELSGDDCVAEGAVTRENYEAAIKNTSVVAATESARLNFKELWSSIHGLELWDSNPWVWAITFKRKE